MGLVADVAGVAAGALELAGIAIITLQAVYSLLHAVVQRLRYRGGEHLFTVWRIELGRGILLGLEFLVAADIIKTVAVELSLYSVGALAAIVGIRTFLSFTLEVEMTGHWPWQKQRQRD
ncbi:MAG: DUF1622 domain-containing protein [Aquisalimonadaceae bacterium]